MKYDMILSESLQKTKADGKMYSLDVESFTLKLTGEMVLTSQKSNTSYPCPSKTELKQDNFLEVSTI